MQCDTVCCFPNLFLAYLGEREHGSECDKCVKCKAWNENSLIMPVCFTHVFVEPTGYSINFCNMYWLYGGYASDQVIAVTNIALWDCFGDEF